MALIHLIVTLLKIAILGCFYATLILVLFRFLGWIFNNSIFYKLSRDKKRLWIQTWIVFVALLTIFSFTHWGRHGLGDNARLPLRHHQSIRESDGHWTTFNHDYYRQIRIIKFEKDGGFVYAQIDKTSNNVLR